MCLKVGKLNDKLVIEAGRLSSRSWVLGKNCKFFDICVTGMHVIRESSFNMTRGDEDIEGGAPNIFRHLKGGL